MARRFSTTWALLAAIICSVLVFAAAAGNEDRFPLRKKWPDLVPVSTSELEAAKSKNAAVVVDVRTDAEYEIMHVEGSHHIPHDAIISKSTKLSELTERPGQLLVFYCNGTTCAKSYKAAEVATTIGLKGVRVYDGGIFEWAETYPEQTIFFGRKMTKALVEQYLVSEEDFDKGPWLVDTAKFIEMANSGQFQVVDIRESRERAEYPIQLANLREATLDQLVRHLEKGDVPKSKILVLDNVGKQIIWAKYYLDQQGAKDYFFLRGGVRQWRADGLDSKGNKLGKVFGRPSPR